MAITRGIGVFAQRYYPVLCFASRSFLRCLADSGGAGACTRLCLNENERSSSSSSLSAASCEPASARHTRARRAKRTKAHLRRRVRRLGSRCKPVAATPAKAFTSASASSSRQEAAASPAGRRGLVFVDCQPRGAVGAELPLHPPLQRVHQRGCAGVRQELGAQPEPAAQRRVSRVAPQAAAQPATHLAGRCGSSCSACSPQSSIAS